MENESLAADLLSGVAAIAEFTGLTQRRVYQPCGTGTAPGVQDWRSQVAGEEVNPAAVYGQA